MKNKPRTSAFTRMTSVRREFISRAILAGLALLLPALGQAGGVVTNATDAALRSAMAAGGTVTFACDGRINLLVTNASMPTEILITNDTVLDGTGHQITIIGFKRAFNVSSNVTFNVINLAIANSLGPFYEALYYHAEPGAGILNDGGTVNLFGVSFLTNAAISGGAIMNLNGGMVNATNCTFAGNFAGRNALWWPFWNGDARGGAISSKSGRVNLENCLFAGNVAAGGPGWGHVSGTDSDAYSGFGGAIHNEGLLIVNACTFQQNSGTGGPGDSPPSAQYGAPGTDGGSGIGGAICNFGTLKVSASTFFSNSAAGGTAGNGMYSLPADFSPAPGGAAGSGGSGLGGALFNSGTASAVNSTFYRNLGTGSSGGQAGAGGAANYGAFGGAGGAGGNGGSGFGSICDTNGGFQLTNCTLAFNFAVAGNGSPGALGGPGHYGRGPSGTNGLDGAVAGGIRTAGSYLVNTLLATNSPGSNCFGWIADAGHNLSSDASCAFTNTGSMNNTDPKLADMADNGGRTLTMALYVGSPAIDAADPAATPVTDQRGVVRPVGPAPDIGAFEYGLPAVLRISGSQATGLDVQICAYPLLSCRLLGSSNLYDWIPIATNQVGTDGTLVFHENYNPANSCRFYRAVVP